LPELIDKELRNVILRVDVNDISKSFIDEMSNLLSNSPGKHSVILKLTDTLNKYEVDLLSRKVKVSLDKKFIKEINSRSQIKMILK